MLFHIESKTQRAASVLVQISLALTALAASGAAQTRVIGWGATRTDTTWAQVTYVEVDATAVATIARTANGEVVAWGANGAHLGAPPQPPAGVSTLKFVAGSYHCVALLSNGTCLGWPGTAEELVGTKAYFVREGLFRDVDINFFSHVSSNFGVSWGSPDGTGLV